ncbi:MAG: SPOR domain-containing protein [Gammaproteobacteria bacterium]|nr:SPOR domain-containing protein [Gammaproteobacteria bacterium]
MDKRFKQRLAGAVVLVALGVIFIPMLLSGPVQQTRVDIELDIPPEPTTPAVPELPDVSMSESQPEQPPEPESQPEPQPESVGDVFVQVGSFASRENAQRLVDTLASAEFSVRMITEDASEQAPHRVQVGPFAGREAAEQAAQTLAEDHELPSLIVEQGE